MKILVYTTFVIILSSVVDGEYKGSYHGQQSRDLTLEFINGNCVFEKYEGGDGTVQIQPIPTIKAKVPIAVIAEMLGQNEENDDSFWYAKTGLKVLSAVFSKLSTALKATAPKLGPCLGLLGMGLGQLSDQLTNVKPKQIIDEVNKAIGKVIEESNSRFEAMKEYVDQSIRNLLKEFMNADYQGQFETWSKCIDSGTVETVNQCQRHVALRMTELKWRFMNYALYKNPDGPISTNDIKVLELQLPFTKLWADLHFLVLAALMKTYEEMEDTESTILYAKYKQDLNEDGRHYIDYMQWAVDRIRRARVDEDASPPTLTCDDFKDETNYKLSIPNGRRIVSSKRRCLFKITKFTHKDCELVSEYICKRESSCLLCNGLHCSIKQPMKDQHEYFDSDQNREVKILKTDYRTPLIADLNAFWQREILEFIPKYKALTDSLGDSTEEEGDNEEGSADKRDETELTAEEKEMNRQFEVLSQEKKERNDRALEGITEGMSFYDYLVRVKENTDGMDQNEEKKKKKKIKKKKEKNKGKEKQKKKGQQVNA